MARGAQHRGVTGRGPAQFESSPAPEQKPARARLWHSDRRLPHYVLAARKEDPKGTGAVLKAALAAARKFGAEKTLALIASRAQVINVTLERSAKAPPETHQTSAIQADDYQEHEARRWKEIRQRFLSENKSVTAPELAELTGSKSVNPSSRAHTWASKNRIFSVNDGSVERYPLFQLKPDDAKPRPEIKAVLDILMPQLSNWQVAIWFTAPNAWTGDWRRPVDLLGKDLDAVVNAARQEVAEQVL